MSIFLDPDPSFRKFNTCFPYDRDFDAFDIFFPSREYSGLGNVSQSTTHSTLHDEPERTDKGSEPGEAWEASNPPHDLQDTGVNLDEIYDIVTDSPKADTSRLQTWIQKIRDHNVRVDIDRVTRFVLLRNRHDLLSLLTDSENVNLERLDQLGRPAIFYAAYNGEIDTLYHVIRKLGYQGFQTHLKHTDVLGCSILLYARKLDSVSCVELLLAAGGRHTGQGMWDAYVLSATNSMSDFLLTLYGVLRPFLKMRIYTQNFTRPLNEGMSTVFTLDQIIKSDLAPLPDVQWMATSKEDEGGSTWTHIPWTNGVIAYAVYRAIQRKVEIRRRACLNRALGDSPHSPLNDNSEEGDLRVFLDGFSDPPTVPGDRALYYRIPTYNPGRGERPGKNSFSAVVFPCLALECKQFFTSLRDEHHELQERTGQGLGSRLMHTARSLDEAYFPSLNRDVMKSRNDDQVVSRECKTSPNGHTLSKTSRPILMVPQFWMWKLDNNILSAYSVPGKTPQEDLDDGDLTYYEYGTDIDGTEIHSFMWERDNIGFTTDFSQDVHPDLQIGRLLAGVVQQFGRPQAGGRFQSPLDIFEVGVNQVMSRVHEHTKPDMNGKPRKLDMKKDIEFTHSITDIRSELAMINEILSQQVDIVRGLIQNSHSDAKQHDAWKEIENIEPMLMAYQARVMKIDGDAERVEKTIQDQLNLQRTYATIQDTRISLVLGTAVIGFTIVTIVFTPIAFMATLFALPIDWLAENQVEIGGASGPAAKNEENSSDKTKVYSTRYIGIWFVTAEIVTLIVTGSAVLLALWAVGIWTWDDFKAKIPWSRKEKTQETHMEETSPDSATNSIVSPRRPGSVSSSQRRSGASNRDRNSNNSIDLERNSRHSHTQETQGW